MPERTRVLGLTGGIGMGKSTAASMFQALGVPVLDSDAEVHRLFRRGGAAVGPVGTAFPGCIGDEGAVDRAALGRAVFGNPEALHRLEAIVHPLVRRAQERFVQLGRRHLLPLLVLDIPLLFETGGERRVDAVATVSAPQLIQAQRVLRRPGMTAERLKSILARQMADRERRRRADYIIPSGLGRRAALEVVARIVREVRSPGAQLGSAAP